MLPCIDCGNPCADLWRWQCQHTGPGYAPCEERDRREKRWLRIAVASLTAALLIVASITASYMLA